MHTHTCFSDGKDTMEEMVIYAIKKGIKRLGISDHYETIKCHSVCKGKLGEYIETVNLLKEKYKGQIAIEAGIELCMDQDLVEIDKLPYEQLNQLDYVLFEYVEDADAYNPISLKQLKAYRDKVTCKVGLAHTDVVTIGEQYGFEETIKLLKALDIFWEINVSYAYTKELLEEEPTSEVETLFQLIRKYDLQLTAGSDNHGSKISYEGKWYNLLIQANQLVQSLTRSID